MRWPWWRLWKFQRRGSILDVLFRWRPGLVVCKHLRVWPEGDYFRPRGRACEECVERWRREVGA